MSRPRKPRRYVFVGAAALAQARDELARLAKMIDGVEQSAHGLVRWQAKTNERSVEAWQSLRRTCESIERTARMHAQSFQRNIDALTTDPGTPP